MIRVKTYRIPFLLCCVILISCQLTTKAQIIGRYQNPDSLRMLELYDQAKSLNNQNLYMEAISSAEEALQYSMRLDKQYYEIRILDLIGDIYSSNKEYANSIPYYLRTANLYETRNDSVRLPWIYEKIAIAYQEEEVLEKSYEYYKKAFILIPDEDDSERLRLKKLMAVTAFKSEQMDIAREQFHALEEIFPQESSEWIISKQYLIQVFDAANQYDSALIYCRELLSIFESRSDSRQAFRYHNNLGYYQTLLENYREASESYIAAINSGNKAKADPKEIALMMTNAGVCFQNLERRKMAIDYFNQAIQLLDEHDHFAEKSRVENMLATIYFREGDLYNAGLFSLRAIESAREAGQPLRESEAYFTYSQVLREGNDPINALENYEKYLSIRDSLSLERKIAEQELEKRKFVLEKEERDLQLRLKEEEVSDLAIRQLMLQNDKIEQEKELLMSEKDRQILEQERLQQDVVIARQNYIAMQQEKENQMLELQKKNADTRLEIEVGKQKEQEQEIQLLEQQQRLDQLDIERQEATKKAFIIVSVGGFLIAIIILSLLISTRRKKKLLATQKAEIEEKNVDLEQKNEEISTQRDEIEAQRNLVFDQKEAIELYNEEIMKSIEYAKRIQSSTLPDLSLMKEFLPESFVLFRPRDVVSGDFYWFANVEGKSVFVVADSTGHGVPGAFMSMMGVSLLKEIVQKEYITHPGVILRRLRKEIISSMGQKGVLGEQRDGYDMALICVDYKEKLLEYAGAYNSLYLIRKNNIPAPDLEELKNQVSEVLGEYTLYEISADKMPIAHYDRMDKFANKEFPLAEGDMLYMFTDGYADQFGGKKGKKFMYKPFKKLLLSNAHHPMEVQHKILNDTLSEWMGVQSQVDDICVMGVKI